MVAVAMADKHIELFEQAKRMLSGQDSLVRSVLAGVEEEACFADRYQKAAASQILYCNVFHRDTNAPFPGRSLRKPSISEGFFHLHFNHFFPLVNLFLGFCST